MGREGLRHVDIHLMFIMGIGRGMWMKYLHLPKYFRLRPPKAVHRYQVINPIIIIISPFELNLLLFVPCVIPEDQGVTLRNL